jgi:hypothetical protein
VDEKVFFTSDDGETFVLKAGPEFKLLRVNCLNEQTLASPALVDGRWYFRTSAYMIMHWQTFVIEWAAFRRRNPKSKFSSYREALEQIDTSLDPTASDPAQLGRVLQPPPEELLGLLCDMETNQLSESSMRRRAKPSRLTEGNGRSLTAAITFVSGWRAQ